MKIAAVSVAFLVVVIFLTGMKTEKDRHVVSIEKALRTGMIQATIKSRGSYQGNCMMLTVKNLTRKDTTVLIEAGRRLVCRDSSKQDILIIREQLIALDAGQETTVNLFGFCCEMTNHAPTINQVYQVGYMTDTPLVVLAKFLNDHDFPVSAMQSAIWCLSDGLGVSSIYDMDAQNILELRKFVSMLKGVPMPWYSVTYKQDTARLFTGIHEMLYGSISYHISNPGIQSLMVYDKNGNLVDGIFINRPILPGDYSYPIDLDVRTYPKGKYYLRLFFGRQQIQEKVFEL